MTQDELANDLKEIAEKFLQKAKTESNTKTVLASLQIVEAAIKLATRCRRIPQEDVLMLDFLDQAEDKVLRSQLFPRYVAYCESMGEKAGPRSLLFKMAQQEGFSYKKTNGGHIYAVPPIKRKKPRLELSHGLDD